MNPDMRESITEKHECGGVRWRTQRMTSDLPPADPSAFSIRSHHDEVLIVRVYCANSSSTDPYQQAFDWTVKALRKVSRTLLK
jgi:hypothetical protein